MLCVDEGNGTVLKQSDQCKWIHSGGVDGRCCDPDNPKLLDPFGGPLSKGISNRSTLVTDLLTVYFLKDPMDS